jgi:hypothetical protein
MSDFQKYTRAIELMNAVPGYIFRPHGQGPARDADVVEACARWDELYTFIYANFERPNTYREFGEVKYKTMATWAHENPDAQQDIFDTYELLCEHKQDEVLSRLTKVPPEYRDVVFPVAIARYLLAYKKAAIDVQMLTTFEEFHNRYGVMVIEGATMRSRQRKAA